jgi:hypothetical protein
VTLGYPVLQRKTQYDQHIAYYGVEERSDTIHFTTIAQISALETDSAGYTYTDTASRFGVSFYRLVIGM